MSKLKKILGKFVVTPEHVLKAVKNPDDIARMTPEELKMYKEALDQVFGPKEQRMKALGYNPDKPFTEIKTADKFKYTTNPDLVNQLEATGIKGETVFVKDFSPENVIKISSDKDLQKAHELADIKNRQIIGGRNLEDIMEQSSVVQNKPIYNEKTGAYSIPKGVQVRDKEAAFDPRFANSMNKFAGIAAINELPSSDLSPLPHLKNALSKYNEIKKDLANYLAKEMNLAKDKQTEEDLSNALEIGLDPANLGAIGLGIDTLDFLSSLKAGKK